MKNKKTNTSRKFRALQTFAILGGVATFIFSILATPLAMADQFDNQINALNQDSSQKRTAQSQLGAEAGSLSDEIGKLQAQINAIQGRVNDLNGQIESLKKQIAEAEAELAKQKLVLGETIKATYVDGDVSTIEMLASSKDLSDFFDKQQYRDSVRTKIKNTVDKITTLKVQLKSNKATIEKALAEQQSLQGQIVGQRAEKDRILGLNESQQGALEQQIRANNVQMQSLRAQQAAAYAAYARRNSSSIYGIGEPGNGGYPSMWASSPQDSLIDSWGMYNRECVSYVAWKIAFTGKYVPYGLGNAADWASNAGRYGIPSADGNPVVGSAAMWGSNDGLGTLGHVAYVDIVNSDGSIEVSQYNFIHGQFNRMHVSRSEVSRLTFIYF